MNESVVRLAVVEGKLYIDLQDRSVELAPRQGFVVPKRVIFGLVPALQTVRPNQAGNLGKAAGAPDRASTR